MNSLVRKARRLAGRIIRAIPWLRRRIYSSTDYRIISESEARNGHLLGWHSELTARRQENAYLALLTDLRSGRPRIDFEVAVEAVKATGLVHPEILEVGCGSGYYAEVFEKLLGHPFSYTGLDQAPAMIARATESYPRYKFQIGDAVALPFPDNTFNIVLNGVSLMHILDYKDAIRESARVASQACIFHSVPVLDRRPTTFLRKYAYGSPVAEIIFNESELLATFRTHGLTVVKSWQSIPYDVGHVLGEPSTAKTFLCMVEHANETPQ
jgi:SAM-dependent methyltransferase